VITTIHPAHGKPIRVGILGLTNPDWQPTYGDQSLTITP
jgi:hypothetical protein